MNHDALLALVSAVWVALELVVGIISRRSGLSKSPHDRGSHTLLWVLLIATTFAAGFVRQLPIGRMPDLFWVGIALMLAGMAIRATAILTLRRFFTVQVTIQESHELIDRGIYRVVRHPSYSGALLSFIGLGLAFWELVLPCPRPCRRADRIRLSHPRRGSGAGQSLRRPVSPVCGADEAADSRNLLTSVLSVPLW